jgi:hypothetical protein
MKKENEGSNEFKYREKEGSNEFKYKEKEGSNEFKYKEKEGSNEFKYKSRQEYKSNIKKQLYINNITPWHQSASELWRPPLVSEVSANSFADRGCHVVSVTNPYGRILGF